MPKSVFIGNVVDASLIVGVVAPSHGGTGVANNDAATLTRSGNHALTITTTGVTSVTLPTTGTLVNLDSTQTLENKQLRTDTTCFADASDGNKKLFFNISGFSAATSRTYVFPNASGTVVNLDSVQTLENKSLRTDTTAFADASDGDKKLFFNISGFTAATSRTWIVPNVADTFVGLAAAQAITGKTSVAAGFFSTTASNPASAGVLRLATTEAIKWRNAANDGDLQMVTDASDRLVANDFVASFAALSSNFSNQATTGWLRLHSAETIAWRNAANDGNITVTVGTSDVLTAVGLASQSTVGAAGGASALPATPSVYLRFALGGTQYVIPLYAQA